MSGYPRNIPLVNGIVQMTVTPTALLATDIKVIGWAGTKDGQMYKIDAAGAVPSTAVIRRGVAFSPDGGMYTTTATPTATATTKFGRVIRADGAMHIDTVASGTITLGQLRNANGVWITT